MRTFVAGFLSLLLFATFAKPQTFPTPSYFHQLTFRAPQPQKLAGPKEFRAYLVNGKLRLSVADAVRLALLNNTDVKVSRLPVEDAEYGVERAYQRFDPVATTSFNSSRSKSPTSSQLEGAPTVSDLQQQTQIGYSQTFQTGTNYQVSFNASKFSTNSIFYFLNPSINANLSFTIAQPLLRGRGLFPNRAPIIIARRNLKQSEAVFEGQVNDFVSQVVSQYWAVIQARENLKVLQKSQDLAEATYQQNKRALELGALPPLDIYRSEAEVAQRRVAVIQAEYQLKRAEDQFRLIIGANQDMYIRALDLDLIESAEPSGELLAIDQKEALQNALSNRPEFEALREQLASSEASIKRAHNNLLPEVNLTGFYSSNGLGGNRYDTTVTPPSLISQGGLGDALTQVYGFDFPRYGFSLTLNLPIKNRAAAADLGTARVARRRALYLTRQLQERITLEVSEAVHQLEQAKVSMAAAKVASDLARKNLEAEERKYELGAQTIFFVLQAQTQLAQAEVSLLQSQVNYQVAVSAVKHAIGKLLGDYHIEVDKVTP